MNKRKNKKKKKNERRERGFLMLGIGILLMMTNMIGLDKAFFYCGVVMAGLSLGDIMFDNRYKRRF